MRRRKRSRKWEPTPVFLPEKFHGQRSLAGCSPRVTKRRERLMRLNMHTLYEVDLKKVKVGRHVTTQSKKKKNPWNTNLFSKFESQNTWFKSLCSRE